MSEDEESCGRIDGVCSALTKTNCVELCETGAEKTKLNNSFDQIKAGLKSLDVKNLTIKAAAKLDSKAYASAVFPDGEKIAIASGNKIKILYANSLEEIGALVGHAGPVSTVAVFRDGSKIVSGSWDNTIKIWDAARYRIY